MVLRGWREKKQSEEQKQGIEREKIKFETKVRKRRLKAKQSKRMEK